MMFLSLSHGLFSLFKMWAYEFILKPKSSYHDYDSSQYLSMFVLYIIVYLYTQTSSPFCWPLLNWIILLATFLGANNDRGKKTSGSSRVGCQVAVGISQLPQSFQQLKALMRSCTISNHLLLSVLKHLPQLKIHPGKTKKCAKLL